MTDTDILTIGTRRFSSRLLVGTGKYQDLNQTADAIAASGSQIITVAIRRTNIGQHKDQPNLLDVISPQNYTILPYTSDDPIIAKELQDMGCVAVMPLGSLIGSGLGLLNRHTLSLIIENATVPILVDAGVGTASDAAIAMELGCDGVLMNSAIAYAKDPILMAQAMKNAVISGRLAFLAGRMPMQKMATASSPQTGYFFQ